MIATATPQDLRAAPDTAGKPAGGTEIRILDGDFTEVPTGEVGSIFVRNSTQFDGYTSGKTKDFHDGFMSSGDVGYLDDAGRLFVVGRDDEMIVSGGENVYPIEVEKTLTAHPDVAEASVIGVDDEQYGQRLAAFVVLNDGAVGYPGRTEATRPRQPGELQGAARDHGARRTTSQQHRQDRAPRTAGPRRPCVGAGRCCARQRSCSTPPTACVRSAARATSPCRCSPSAGPPPRCRRCTSPGRCSTRCGAVCAATFAAPAAESPWCSRPSPGRCCGLIQRRNVAVGAAFRGAAARGARRRLRGDRRTVAAGQAASRADRGVPQRVGPSPLRREGGHRPVRPAPSVEPRRHLAPRDLPRDGKAPVLLQVPGGAWVDRHAAAAGLSVAEPSGRSRLGLRVDRLPRQSEAHLAGPHRRRQARAGVDQGATSPTTAATRTSSRSPAVRRADTCARLPR